MNQNFNKNNIMRIDFNRATENIIIYIEDFVWVWTQKTGITEADLLE